VLDYKKWVQRAVEFTTSLRSLPGEIHVTAEAHPPTTQLDVERLSSGLRLPLPEPICVFLTGASSNCSCEYWWMPPSELLGSLSEVFPSNDFIFGGASLCDKERFARDEKGRYDTGEALEKAYPEDAKLWIHSVPFHEVGNGDCLGLYVGPDRRKKECPVVYLDHDGYGGSRVLAPSFDEFLVAWEELKYIGAFFLRQFFLDPISQSINPNSPKKRLLDDLFMAGKRLSC